LSVLKFNKYTKRFIKYRTVDKYRKSYYRICVGHMRPFQVMERAREKAQEVAEKTGEAISKGLTEGWGKAKGLGKDLKKELSRVHERTKRNKTSKKSCTRKGDKQ